MRQPFAHELKLDGERMAEIVGHDIAGGVSRIAEHRRAALRDEREQAVDAGLLGARFADGEQASADLAARMTGIDVEADRAGERSRLGGNVGPAAAADHGLINRGDEEGRALAKGEGLAQMSLDIALDEMRSVAAELRNAERLDLNLGEPGKIRLARRPDGDTGNSVIGGDDLRIGFEIEGGEGHR